MTAQAARPRRRRWWRRALIALLVLFLLTWLPVLLLRFLPPATSAFMLERRIGAALHGEHDFRIRYQWVPWTKIAPTAPLAMVASEDQKFPFHHGFDFESIHQAIDDADQGVRLRGASTISQQTAKNLFLWNGRSLVRKGIEAYFTVLIEATWPKRRILEVYANIAEFGDGIYGVEAASNAYFGEHASQLGTHQAALLAAVLPDPRRLHANHPSAYVQRRAAWIQRQMSQLGGVSYVLDAHPRPPRGTQR
ncbi:MAG: monofunctional biosynthetic peptidoglycan transglycosylase [Proteobacteria bacterium]|nr:monofunctional biosynthetic peptidoglycan transglycosylase [Pseudomonadota bacterium]